MLHAALLIAATRVTWPDMITFWVGAILIFTGAIGVVTSANPVHAALSLVMTLFGIAVLFVEQDADFIAAVQIIVYAGAIVVLFLFVIMFLGVDRREDVNAEALKGQRPMGYVMVAVMLGSIIALMWNANWLTGAHQVVGKINGPIAGVRSPSGEVAQLGKQLFTTYLFAFEATAALLVIAVVGAVVLARRPAGPLSDEADGPDEPGEGGDESVGGDGAPALDAPATEAGPAPGLPAVAAAAEAGDDAPAPEPEEVPR